MSYIVFYIIMIFVGIHIINKFDFNKREVLELISLPMAIPMFGIIFISLFTDNTPFTSDTVMGLVSSPLLVAFVVAVVYPMLILPVLLILTIKQNYKEKPMVFFFLSSLIGGATLSVFALKLEVILTGMFFTLLSVLVQYYYFDKKRNLRSST